MHWVGHTDVNIGRDHPADADRRVQRRPAERAARQPDTVPLTYEPTTLVYNRRQSSVPALAVGVPLGAELPAVLPVPAHPASRRPCGLVQRILVGVGLAARAAARPRSPRWSPGRWCCRSGTPPQAAERLSAGHLDERMQVRGEDDLAAPGHLVQRDGGQPAGQDPRARGALPRAAAVRLRRVARAAHAADHRPDGRRPALRARGELRPGGGRSRRAAAEPAGPVRVAARRPAGDQPVRRGRRRAGRRARRPARPGPAGRPTTRSRWPSARAAGSSSRLPATGLRRRGGPRAGSSGSCATSLVNAVEHGEGKDVVVTVGQRQRRGRGRRPRLRRRAAARRGSSWSSTGSGGPTRRAPAPPAAPASAWPSRSRTPGCTAAGCRPGASRGKGVGVPADPAAGVRAELAGSPLPLGPDEAEIAPSLSVGPVPEITAVPQHG